MRTVPSTFSILFILPLLTQLLPIIYAIKVQGNNFVDDAGQKVMLRGVSHSGSEYSCVQQKGIFEGPTDAAAVAAIKSWGNNVVRIPLNEDCWLGINGVPDKWAGENYQKAIHLYVKNIVNAGLVAILDLHWTASGSTLATKQDPMPDLSHAPSFWTDVAKHYANESNVIFELFNEPFPGKGNADASEWMCWKNGSCPQASGVHFPAAGMEQLVQAIRNAGAKNVILLGALVWSNHMDGWLDYVPTDPGNNMGAVWHSYDFNACVDQGCWDKTVKPVAAKYPVVVTESGFKTDYTAKLWPYLESNGISYMAWTWNTWKGEGLIVNYDGTPSVPWGAAWKAQLSNYKHNNLSNKNFKNNTF